MDRNERLLGPEPTKQFIKKTKTTLDTLFRTRAEQQNARLRLERELNEASFVAVRDLIKGNRKIASMRNKAQKRFFARLKARKRRHLLPKRRAVEPHVRLGSVSATFVPPFISWTWQGGQNGDTVAQYSANANTGIISLSAQTGSGGGSTNVAGALGQVFQPPSGVGILDVISNPAFTYDFFTTYYLASANAGGFFGLYVGEYDLNGQFIQGVVDQQISYSGLGESSGFPLVAMIPADSEHYYVVWVWTGISISGVGAQAFWDSFGDAWVQVGVPSISVYY
jgi:hypothetical protein